MNKQSPEITDEERKFLQGLMVSAQKPLWRHALEIGPGLMMFCAFGTILVWTPTRLHRMGIELCRPHPTPTVTLWSPLDDPRHDVLQQLLGSAGCLVFLLTALVGMALWGNVVRDRKLHRLLSKACPDLYAA